MLAGQWIGIDSGAAWTGECWSEEWDEGKGTNGKGMGSERIPHSSVVHCADLLRRIPFRRPACRAGEFLLGRGFRHEITRTAQE